MKILIELPTWIGDTVMTTPAIENIISYYDNPEITLVGSFSTVELLKNHPKVVNIKVLDKNYISLYKLAKNLGKFDVFFSFRDSYRSKLLIFLISSVKKYQLNDNDFQKCHQVEKYNDFINKSLGTNLLAGNLKLHLDNFAKAESNLVMENSMTLGINPGASYGNAKQWYPEEFANVAAQLSNKYSIVIFGNSAEKDIAADIEKFLIEKGVVDYQNLAGKTSISELIHHISKLDFFITGDSGPMHIAASFQIPTVSIFGPTKTQKTSQWMNKKSTIVMKDLECRPCMKRTCPLKHHNCMKLVKANDVLNAIKKTLN